MQQKRYFQVNWVDGMKINKDHFIALEDSLNDHISTLIADGINQYNYGLLPSKQGSAPSFQIQMSVDNQQMLVFKVLNYCAITPGGVRIHIQENSLEENGFAIPLPELTKGIDTSKDATYFVLLSVSPFSRVPVGNPEPDEEPARFPFTVPDIKVSIIPEEQYRNSSIADNSTCVAKLNCSGGRVEAVNNYIPPCNSVQSHTTLIELHAKYVAFLSNLESHVVAVLKIVKQKEQSYDLASTVTRLCDQLLLFLGNSILNFRLIIANQPPIIMFELIARCARILKNSIEVNTPEAKEELLNYFSEWCKVNQGDLELILVNTANFKYEHHQIENTVTVINQFVEVMGGLFEKLSGLEFIGKKKDTGIFVKEQPQSRNSFLAD